MAIKIRNANKRISYDAISGIIESIYDRNKIEADKTSVNRLMICIYYN